VSWDAIGALGELIGALAVVATLVYLSIQLRQNTKAMHLQTAQAAFQTSLDVVSTIAEGDHPSIWQKFRTSGVESIEDADKRMAAESLARCLFTSYDSHFYQYSRGSLDLQLHEAFERRLLAQLAWPGISGWWKANKSLFTESFQDYVNGLLRNHNE
jgi:hypothetical protein